MAYQDVEVPLGAFIGWGDKPGQVVEGRVTDYDPEGGTVFGGSGAKCPLVEIELTATAYSYTKGKWSTYEAGTTVQITAGQAQLKKKVRKAAPRVGAMIRIEMKGKISVTNGEVKDFLVQVDNSTVDRSAGGHDDGPSFGSNSSAGAPDWGSGSSEPAGWGAPIEEPPADDEPPF
jgi:hypothetical protein